MPRFLHLFSQHRLGSRPNHCLFFGLFVSRYVYGEVLERFGKSGVQQKLSLLADSLAEFVAEMVVDIALAIQLHAEV
jgi:hypothetical protein